MKLVIERVHHAQITVPIGAEDEARGFYCDFLGLEEIPKPESLQGRGGFWVEVDAFQIHVGVEENFHRRETKAHLAFQVNNLTAWRLRLEAIGKSIIEGVPIPGYDRFEFRDPFGNRVEFLQKI